MTAMLRRVSIILVLFLSQQPASLSRADICPRLSLDSATARTRELNTTIKHHNHLYYTKNTPEISDGEYDRLLSELILLEGCFPQLATKDSPTNTVGDEIGDTGGATIRHEKPMLSLSSSLGSQAVEALLRKTASADETVTLLVQPKVDGLPVELVYVDGRLISAATRGDGSNGENVTVQVREIQGIPSLLEGRYPTRVVVRGEIYADTQAAVTLADSKKVKYATLRHLAAGTVLSDTPDPQSLAILRFFPFDLVNTTVWGNISSDRQALGLLAGWGFSVLPEQIRSAKSLEDVKVEYRWFLANRDRMPFAMDGIVVKVDDLPVRQRLGEGSRAPFWAAAWKFPPATARTVVREIRWQVGRTGRRTPVAELEPIRLGGTLVRKVSLHNSTEVSRLGIAAGDQVVVALIGDVIPQIVEIIERNGNAAAIETASDSATSGSNDCFRDTPGCRDRFISRAAYFTSRSGLDIKGLGRGRLKALIEAGLLTDLPSILHLTSENIPLASVLGPKTALKVTDAIHSRRHPQHFHLVAAIGISGVGPVAADRLAHQFSNLTTLLAADEQLINDLPKGSATARLVRDFFGTPQGKELWQNFHDLGIW